MGFEAILALAVVAGIFLALLLTRWPVEAAFLGGIVVLVGGGALPIDRAFAGFANSGLVTVALLYVVAGGYRKQALSSGWARRCWARRAVRDVRWRGHRHQRGAG